MFKSTLRVIQDDSTSMQATTSTVFMLQEGKVTKPAVYLHARAKVPEVILQPQVILGQCSKSILAPHVMHENMKSFQVLNRVIF